MEKQEVIRAFQKTISGIYMEYGLTALRGIDNKCEVSGREIILWHYETTKRNFENNNRKFNYRKNLDDLLFCSDELLYFTAHLFLYKPFINNPIEEAYKYPGGIIYPNIQTLETKRYSMYADITSQIAYNYWDRIGDLIASFFPTLLNPERVYFPIAIEIIPEIFHNSDNYLWLKDFKENGYAELNKMRKQIVHYATSNTEFKHRHLAQHSDKEALQELQAKKESLTNFYKSHITLTLTGLEKTLLLLEDFNLKLFPNME